jgi:hypothetical protein
LPTGQRSDDWPGLKTLVCRYQPSYWQVAFEVILDAICAERLVLALVCNKPNAAPDDVLDVADPNIEADMEQLRNRMLINEFQRYQQLKGKLKLVRTEALRAGFKDAWQTGKFESIVEMVRRVPEVVIQEDPALLLYYDNALMRVGE